MFCVKCSGTGYYWLIIDSEGSTICVWVVVVLASFMFQRRGLTIFQGNGVQIFLSHNEA